MNSPKYRKPKPSKPLANFKRFRDSTFKPKVISKKKYQLNPVRSDKKTDRSERIQKAFSSLGLGARREIEKWILQHKIKINGQLAKLGDSVIRGDKIEILSFTKQRLDKGKFRKTFIYQPISNQPRILLYHKPEGEIVSKNDPMDRPTVFSKLPRLKVGKWINIGRLDFQTSGLLLFTNNGDFANKMMHPSTIIEREYAVRIAGKLSKEQINQLMAGITVNNTILKCTEVNTMGAKDQARNQWYKMIITQGRNREIRKMIEQFNLLVSRIIRIRYGPIILPRSLRRGKFNELSEIQVKKLIAKLI